jgi:histidine ammonia-lyase
MPGAAALKAAGLEPVVLAKEGLALINGTQFSTACALAGLFEARRAGRAAIVTSCAVHRCDHGVDRTVCRPEIHALRGHLGPDRRGDRHARAHGRQRKSAKATATATPACRTPIASAASRRSTGAAVDLMRQAGRTLEIEANAVTDNPLVLEGRE